jgi:chorismate-pyruvate lyase
MIIQTFLDGLYFDESLTKTIDLFRYSCTVDILCKGMVKLNTHSTKIINFDKKLKHPKLIKMP